MGIILRTTLGLFLSLLFTQNVFSQESDMEDRKVRFGLLASPNLGWMRPNISDFEKSGLQSRLGFGYGLMLDYKFSNSPNYLAVHRNKPCDQRGWNGPTLRLLNY